MNPQDFTGWWFTDARQVPCPKCGAAAGAYCRTQGGRKTGGGIPHGERTKAIGDLVGGSEPWQGRQSLEAWKARQVGLCWATDGLNVCTVEVDASGRHRGAHRDDRGSGVVGWFNSDEPEEEPT
jgi:hypothetical protein